MEVWGHSAADYEAAASRLGQTVLQNVNITDNNVSGILTAETDTLLCFSIPYSTGWRAVIDGRPAPLRRANSMVMALEAPAGEHVIGLYYITPGLKYGLVLSVLGALALAAQLLWYRRKKRSGRRAAR